MDYLKKLDGYKFHLTMALGALVWFGQQVGLLPDGSLASATPLLILMGGSATRSALNKLGK